MKIGAELSLQDLSKSYDDKKLVLNKLNITAAPGEIVSLLGPSGCGKSTALRIVAGLVGATSGRVMLAGKEVTSLPTYKRNIGLVFQNYALFPHMTVLDNVAFGLEMRNVNRKEARSRAGEILEMVRLGSLGQRRPRQLSGGQQQRVALARALVIHPDLLLLDEPLSNLDAKLREQMQDEIRDLQQRLGTTTIFVTHDQSEAMAISDHVAIMNEGVIVQYGRPTEIYENPASSFVANFIGRVNSIDGISNADGDASQQIKTDTGLSIKLAKPSLKGPVQFLIRPSSIEVLPSSTPSEAGRNRVPASVRKVTYAGDIVSVACDTQGIAMTAEVPGSSSAWRSLEPGQQVTLDWPVASGFVFERKAN
ncbi:MULTISPECIES: ABC transporter ATP-binding protein [Agrobacterium]|uniref:ABC transporter ATP-binding protein n=1 Tax=Agrobacterium TaxID=357 RepID=UPI001573D0C9|nr:MULTISPECIES: ABC transporter ATP-binding protein [Agrobacterium]NSX89007.1 ABC transporter ATP-binding protein [Agrobacterium tumefaciens]NSZ19663.1 ABC transporter ATP-binding protein [Agrobacterium vitis]QZO06892.1 ABC transporter ATP-binding protein [Agrobacterium vitis]UJL91434.1 ABC transporter ATP-binding protein [Agrobacterium vitis]